MRALWRVSFCIVVVLCLVGMTGCKVFGKKNKRSLGMAQAVRIERELDMYYGPLDAKAKTLKYVLEQRELNR